MAYRIADGSSTSLIVLLRELNLLGGPPLQALAASATRTLYAVGPRKGLWGYKAPGGPVPARNAGRPWRALWRHRSGRLSDHGTVSSSTKPTPAVGPCTKNVLRRFSGSNDGLTLWRRGSRPRRHSPRWDLLRRIRRLRDGIPCEALIAAGSPSSSSCNRGGLWKMAPNRDKPHRGCPARLRLRRNS